MNEYGHEWNRIYYRIYYINIPIINQILNACMDFKSFTDKGRLKGKWNILEIKDTECIKE